MSAPGIGGWDLTLPTPPVVIPPQVDMNPVGCLLPFAGAGTSTPAGYLLCNGSAISQATYSALFSVIGTRYNASSGGTPGAGLFRLPNLVSRYPSGTTPGNEGLAGGASTVDITHIHSTGLHQHGFTNGAIANIVTVAATPSIYMQRVTPNPAMGWTTTHSMSVTPVAAGTSSGQTLGALVSGYTGDNLTDDITGGITGTGANGSASRNNLPPYLAINFIIKF